MLLSIYLQIKEVSVTTVSLVRIGKTPRHVGMLADCSVYITGVK